MNPYYQIENYAYLDLDPNTGSSIISTLLSQALYSLKSIASSKEILALQTLDYPEFIAD